jgi:hypothetical protein
MMLSRSTSRRGNPLLVVAGAGALLAGMFCVVPAAAQRDVTPDTTPVITDFNPKQAAIGEEVKLTIEGKNFAPGVYVSFSTPLVHAVATERKSATKLEVTLRIGNKAEADVVSLYVSNTGSVVAEVPFKIVSQPGPTSAPPSTALGASAPAQATPSPAAHTATAAAAPEIQKVDPRVAPRGGQVELKITGKNFVKGAKVAISNPGIRVLETQVNKDTELVARIQVRADAAPGETNLFVINPDEEEAEAQFVVSEEVSAAKTAAAAAPTSTPSTVAAPPPTPAATAAGQPAAPQAPTKPTAAKAGGEALRLEVYGIADVSAVLQARNKPKGALTLEGGTLRFEEAGKEVFAAAASDVKEVDVNMLLGMNTGTFHVILSSGQTYNFVATSLRPADSQAMVDALKRALK